VLFESSIALTPAYELKANNPLADTAMLTVPPQAGERSHGAKLTRRLTGSILLYLTTQMGINPYWPSTIGGAFLLLSGIVVGERVTRDRQVGLFLGLSIAGLYATNACFCVNVSPKPFDGIALGLIAACFLTQRSSIQLPLAFFACWADERAILGILCLAAYSFFSEEGAGHSILRASWKPCSVVVAYLVTRWFLGLVLNWQPADASMLGGSVIRTTLPYWQVAFWTGLEGGGILVLIALLSEGRNRAGRFILVLLLLVFITANLLVIDISRGAAFTFPLIFVALSAIQRNSGTQIEIIRRLVMASALVSLSCPNLEVMAEIIFRPLPTLPVELWLRWNVGL